MNKEELFGNSQQNTGYVTFEEVASAFKIPTQMQADYDPKPEPSPGSGANPTAPMGDLSHLADPNGEALNDLIPTEPEPAPVDHDHAMRTGERIARMVDTGIDFTLSNFVAKNGESYRADERDLQDIAECWGELAEEKGWSIGPEWSLIILYIMVYGPLVKQAVADRKMAELEARQAALEAQMKLIQMQQGTQQPQPNGNPNPTNSNATGDSPFNYQPNA